MARRFTRDPMVGEEKPTSGPISLAGLVKLQPNKKKGNRNWRPLQLSDFGTDPDSSTQVGDSDNDEYLALTDNFNSKLDFTTSQIPSSRMAASPFDLPRLQTRNFSPLNQRSSIPASGMGSDVGSGMYISSENMSPADTRHSSVDERARLFGKTLPDPIRLHEEVGAFDGKVMYIGHPNRDISAHQWSDHSYQWVNIGLYSQNRHRIEGSLASDRIRGIAPVPNTLEYFKAVAEAREMLVKENGRLEHQGSTSKSVNDGMRSAFADGDMLPASTAQHLQPLHQMDSSSKTAIVEPPAKKPAIRTVARDYLEDPFVSPDDTHRPASSIAFNFTANRSADSAHVGHDLVGAMDFNYEFPTRSDTMVTSQDRDNQRNHFARLEEERIRRELLPQIHQPQPHASFTGETIGGLEASARRPTITQSHLRLSLEDVHKRQVLKNRLAELGDSARSPASSANRRIAIPDVRTLQAPNRPVYPLGLTIANPNRFVSTLNATAAPYNHRGSFVQTVDESGSEATTVNAPASLTTALRFSEPDGARQSATHTVVNGFNHQLPTPQNLRGPYRFFQDSVPTTLSPTTSLSVTVNDDEKLQNWFHDGQRPARIEDHWKSIMASENSSGQNVGVIGQGSVATENNSKYENTPIFMRLIETLQRYKDDSQAFSGGSDYFTRAFKAVPKHLKDEGPDGNNSFFGEDYGALAQRPTFNADPPATFGASSSSGTPAPTGPPPGFGSPNLGIWGLQGLRQQQGSREEMPPVQTMFQHGNVASGGFGGPISYR